jgi:hypothetical protein
LDQYVQVLPGHYMDWSEMTKDSKFIDSLGHIISVNSDIYDIEELALFTGFIKKNMRKQPDVYAMIRQVNAGLQTPDDEEQKIMDIGKNECAATGA